MQASQPLPFTGLPYPSINGMPNLPISPGGLKQEVASERELKQLKRKQACFAGISEIPVQFEFRINVYAALPGEPRLGKTF